MVSSVEVFTRPSNICVSMLGTHLIAHAGAESGAVCDGSKLRGVMVAFATAGLVFSFRRFCYEA